MIIELPVDTGVITPAELIVATAGVPEVQLPPELPLVLNVVVALEQILFVPDKIPALGAAVTVTTLVVELEHPDTVAV